VILALPDVATRDGWIVAIKQDDETKLVGTDWPFQRTTLSTLKFERIEFAPASSTFFGPTTFSWKNPEPGGIEAGER
jgi:hypothetical protein